MTLKFNRVLDVVEIHDHAKFHQAECSSSWVIVRTEKKLDENNTVHHYRADSKDLKKLFHSCSEMHKKLVDIIRPLTLKLLPHYLVKFEKRINRKTSRDRCSIRKWCELAYVDRDGVFWYHTSTPINSQNHSKISTSNTHIVALSRLQVKRLVNNLLMCQWRVVQWAKVLCQLPVV